MSINLLWYCRVKAKNVSFELFKNKSLKITVLNHWSYKHSHQKQQPKKKNNKNNVENRLPIQCITNKMKFFVV